MDVSEQLIRVPLVFAPLDGSRIGRLALQPGRRVSQLVRQIDVIPTILDVLGAPVPDEIHGRSLKPTLASDADLGLEAYLEAFLRIRSDPADRLVGWRTDEWKYTYAPQNPRIPETLYALRDDPSEAHNLRQQRPDVALELRRRVESIQQGPIAANPGHAMSEAERARLEKRLADLGYL